jgi:hypothetical protein
MAASPPISSISTPDATRAEREYRVQKFDQRLNQLRNIAAKPPVGEEAILAEVQKLISEGVLIEQPEGSLVSGGHPASPGALGNSNPPSSPATVETPSTSVAGEAAVSVNPHDQRKEQGR